MGQSKTSPRGEVAQLLAFLDQAYNRSSWHGTNLRGSIRRVTPEQAAWRPGAGRHNIWENVVHAAYWKYAASRRFVDQPQGSFHYKGSNWFRRPDDPSARAWKADVALLDEMHALLRGAVAQLSRNQLYVTPAGKKVNNFVLLSGIAAHDLYHAGQIQLLKRLSK
jgi:DinB superfamily